MIISWKLKGLLMDHGLDKRGVLLRMSKDTKIHRTTISNMYRDQAPNVSLETLGKLCQWLRQSGVKEEDLPGALLTKRPAALFETLAARGATTIILGEYLPAEKTMPAYRWVARRDAHVAANIIDKLSDSSQVGGKPPRVQMTYVPFHHIRSKRFPQNKAFHQDVANAKQVCQKMRKDLRHSSAVLIGSPHINYAVEHYVAELFDCEPFKRPRGIAPVPFFRAYREYESELPSCCGGTELPDEDTRAKPGIYYRDDSNRWSLLPWKDAGEDAAVIITTYDSGTDEFVMVILGYSGRATAAAGSEVALHPDRFWRTPSKSDPRPLTVIYLCRVLFNAPKSSDEPEDPPAQEFEIVHRIDPLRPSESRSL